MRLKPRGTTNVSTGKATDELAEFFSKANPAADAPTTMAAAAKIPEAQM